MGPTKIGHDFRQESATKMKYSRVHKSSDSFFSKILEKPSIVQKKVIPHIKAKVFFIGNKQKRKKKFEKKNSKWPT